MTKSQRKLFIERVEKIFEAMDFMPPPPQEWMNKIQVVDNIRQLYSRFTIHKLTFIRNETFKRMSIRHDVRVINNDIEMYTIREDYNFHPKRQNKFELGTVNSSQIHVKLFDRWSRIDVDDLLRRLDLKLVELI